jgi:hypothetical protein
MSVSAEVQRTLVKSPPELWAELGSPEALTKHLGELGEIRITAVEPESKVEWEAEGASGVVELKQSGWGTKVTLSLMRQTPEADSEPEDSEPEPDADTTPSAVAEPEPETRSEAEPQQPAVVPAPEAALNPQPENVQEQEAEPMVEPEPEPISETAPNTAPIAERKPGFFARLFKRRSAVLALSEARKIVAEPEPRFEALALPEPIYPAPPPQPVEPVEPVADLAAELAEVEAQIEQESTELLTGVLDRLGAAHHRPFSRG